MNITNSYKTLCDYCGNKNKIYSCKYKCYNCTMVIEVCNTCDRNVNKHINFDIIKKEYSQQFKYVNNFNIELYKFFSNFMSIDLIIKILNKANITKHYSVILINNTEKLFIPFYEKNIYKIFDYGIKLNVDISKSIFVCNKCIGNYDYYCPVCYDFHKNEAHCLSKYSICNKYKLLKI